MSGPDDFTGKFYEIFRAITPMLLKLFPKKIAEEGTSPNSVYEAIITLMSKLDKDIIKT